MYGNDANFIDPTNMMEVAKTMNNKFLSKWCLNGYYPNGTNIVQSVIVVGLWNHLKDILIDINGNVSGLNVGGKHLMTAMVDYIGGRGGEDEIYNNNGDIYIILWNYAVGKLQKRNINDEPFWRNNM